MRRAGVALLTCLTAAAAGALAVTPAKAAASCAGFMDAFAKAAPGLRCFTSSIARPVAAAVSRPMGSATMLAAGRSGQAPRQPAS